MRDLKPGDKLVIDADGHVWIEHSYADGGQSSEPMCWANPHDWARWWIRQAEINEDVSLPPEFRQLLSRVLAS